MKISMLQFILNLYSNKYEKKNKKREMSIKCLDFLLIPNKYDHLNLFIYYTYMYVSQILKIIFKSIIQNEI